MFIKSLSFSTAFISLLDNYETSTGVEEIVTPEEVAENNCFLDAILTTGVMKVSHEFSFVTEDTELQIHISLFSILQLAHEYLLKKKLAKPNLADFKYQLYDIWFQLYPRKEGDRYVQ